MHGLVWSRLTGSCLIRTHLSKAAKSAARIALLAAPLSLMAVLPVEGEAVNPKTKRVIGATATITELTTGLPFVARVDTGAATCSIHTIKWEIKNKSRRPSENVGKPIRVLIKNGDGDEKWIDTVVAGRVRIRNSALDDDDYHGRYKIKLPLEWEGFKKDVLVTINDRTNMEYPLLIGRNFLSRDFVVDVDHKNGDHKDGDEKDAGRKDANEEEVVEEEPAEEEEAGNEIADGDESADDAVKQLADKNAGDKSVGGGDK